MNYVFCYGYIDECSCEEVNKDNWSTKQVIKTPFFSEALIQSKRFLQILHVIHFVDNSSVPSGPDRDRLWKIRPVFYFLLSKFSGIYMHL